MDTLVKLATISSPIISAIVTIGAILVAIKTINESKEIAKKTVADTAYQVYLELAMDHTNFAKGYEAVSKKDPKYDQYIWYLARMLFCFEQIIEVKGSLKDESWDKTLTKHLSFHAEHFKKTKVVEQKLYCTPLLDLIMLSKH